MKPALKTGASNGSPHYGAPNAKQHNSIKGLDVLGCDFFIYILHMICASIVEAACGAGEGRLVRKGNQGLALLTFHASLRGVAVGAY